MKSIGRAPGKLILSGEHSVVYGYPAVAAAIDMWMTVELHRQEGPFQTNLNDPRVTKGLTQALPTEGLRAFISSDLPIGRGLGSSAALSIASLRAWADLNSEAISFESLYREGFKIETIFHGNPSGVDHAVSALQCGLIYNKDGPVFEPLSLPKMTLVIMDCGRASNTAQMVQKAANAPPDLFKEIGRCTHDIIALLKLGRAGDELGAHLTENHQLLKRIKVSDPELDAMVEAALNAGALGAKLAGAGGGGVAFALVEDPAPIHKAIAHLGFESYTVKTLTEKP